MENLALAFMAGFIAGQNANLSRHNQALKRLIVALLKRTTR